MLKVRNRCGGSDAPNDVFGPRVQPLLEARDVAVEPRAALFRHEGDMEYGSVRPLGNGLAAEGTTANHYHSVG